MSSKLGKQIQSKREDVIGLEAQLAEMIASIEGLRAQQSVDMGKASIASLLKVARGRAGAQTELEAAQLAKQEIERRLAMGRKELADLERRQRAEQVEGLQLEVDQLSLAICDGPFAELIERIKEARVLEEHIMSNFGVTPLVTFPVEWRETLEHRLDLAKRELEGRLA